MLTSKDIIDIIRACNKSRVSNFELGDLKIKFDEPAEIASSPKTRSSWSSKETEPPEGQPQNPEQLELEEIAAFEAEIRRAQLALTDPSSFEELQLEGDDNEEA